MLVILSHFLLNTIFRLNFSPRSLQRASIFFLYSASCARINAWSGLIPPVLSRLIIASVKGTGTLIEFDLANFFLDIRKSSVSSESESSLLLLLESGSSPKGIFLNSTRSSSFSITSLSF